MQYYRIPRTFDDLYFTSISTKHQRIQGKPSPSHVAYRGLWDGRQLLTLSRGLTSVVMAVNPTHNANSSFFQLPREIRDLVYWHAVVKDESVGLNEPLRENETRFFRVCKQIHEEASEVFYKESLFFIPAELFTKDEPVDRMLAGPLYRLPPKRLAIVRRLDVDVPVCKDPKMSENLNRIN